MRKKYIVFLIVIGVVQSVGNTYFTVSANEVESQATVKIIRENPSIPENNEDNKIDYEKNDKELKEKENLPKANDVNSLLISIIGTFILLIGGLGLFGSKKEVE